MTDDNTQGNGQKPLNSITIEEAIQWTKTWQTENSNHSKAFLIPIVDVLNLLEELGILEKDAQGNLSGKAGEHQEKGIRAYMGIGPDDAGKTEEKLVMVGAVNVSGNFEDQVEKSDNRLQVKLMGSGAFDFTLPCPKYCDTKSPLFHK